MKGYLEKNIPKQIPALNKDIIITSQFHKPIVLALSELFLDEVTLTHLEKVGFKGFVVRKGFFFGFVVLVIFAFLIN